jgi:hypothetical protein
MNTDYVLRLSTVVLIAGLSTGCSTLTDSIAASSQTFTNTTKATSEVISSQGGSKSSQLQQAVKFASINWMRLAENMANGQGEHLQTLADLLGVKPAQKPAFYAMTKNHYQQLFPSAQITPEQLIHNLQIEIKQLGNA